MRPVAEPPGTKYPTLDPDLSELLGLDGAPSPFDDLAAARAGVAALVAGAGQPPGVERLDVVDRALSDDAAVRVYVPRDDAPLDGRRPGLLYLHGGGFCLGSVDVEHAAATDLALRLGAVVVSVEYRLAPEHPYPAGLDDCYAALLLLAARPDVDPARVAVHGTSAGGGLAAAVALLARDRGGPSLCFQSLVTPALDDRLETPSMRAFTDTPMWSRTSAERSWRHYLGGGQADAYAAPARADDLAGLPPAYVVTCELDPLRDEGLAYAGRLLAAGVSTEVHNVPGTFHGFTLVRTAEVVGRMEHELVAVLRRGLRAPTSATEVRSRT